MSSNLAAAELLKEATEKRENRVTTFLRKYEKQEDFELVSGGKVKLKVLESTVASLKAAVKLVGNSSPAINKNLNALPFFSKTGKTVYHLAHFAKTSEFGGGKAGGSVDTERNECAQAVYCAARWNLGRAAGAAGVAYSKPQLIAALSDVKISLQNTKKITETLPKEWQQSSVMIANMLYLKYPGKKYTFHRKSAWVTDIEKRFKALNDELGAIKSPMKFSNINRWTPADIWMVAKGAEKELDRINLKKADSFPELNKKLFDCAKSGDILGVSLKYTSTTPKFKQVNFEKFARNFDASTVPDITFRKLSVDGGRAGAPNFFNNKSVDLEFSKDDIILYRTFDVQSGYAGELSGKDARHGKIGLGEISKIYREITDESAPQIAPTLARWKAEKRTPFFTEFLKYAEKLSKDTGAGRTSEAPARKSIKDMNVKEFEKIASAKTGDWILSKYIGCYILYHLQTEGNVQSNMDKFVALCYLTASSQLPNSAPFIKIGGV